MRKTQSSVRVFNMINDYNNIMRRRRTTSIDQHGMGIRKATEKKPKLNIATSVNSAIDDNVLIHRLTYCIFI